MDERYQTTKPIAEGWIMTSSPEITTGDVVRDTKWSGRYTGTVVRVEGDSIFVQWHGSCVEDQLTTADVTLAPEIPNPPDNGLRLLTFHSDRLDRVTIRED